MQTRKNPALEPEHVDLIDDDPLEEQRVPERAKSPELLDTITLEEWIALLPRSEKLTRWRNPTNRPVRVRLVVRGYGVRAATPSFHIPRIDDQLVVVSSVGTGARMQRRRGDLDVVCAVWCDVEIPPGGEVDLPREQDGAILVIRAGRIVGGHAPQLRPVNRALHATPAPALDDVEIEASRRRDLEQQAGGR